MKRERRRGGLAA